MGASSSASNSHYRLSPRIKRPRLAPFALLTSRNLAAFRRKLLGWYDVHRRDLPWRASSDPYRIWLSEIMLQQTRVAAVLEHYRIFLERFPDVKALAAASENAVLAAWSGLGYYRRARMMHRCARELTQKHASQFPRSAEALLLLPGIGRYTAAAIGSIAFAEPVPVVDGNVERVLQRLFGTRLTTTQNWQRAQQLLDCSRPGDFNQAMMELGATVCVPREPRCLACPIQKWCLTRGEMPRIGFQARPVKKEIWCALELREGKGGAVKVVRLVQRLKGDSLMPGMWELPQVEGAPSILRESAPWRTFRHSITVTDYTVHVVRSAGLRTKRPMARGKWVPVDRVASMPMTGLARKILRAGGII